MESLECVLYRYMCSRSPWMSDLIEEFIAAITGPQVCHYPDLKYSVTGTRMSGDICTSLGNGFSNLVMNLFVASKCGASIKGFVEGDDGIFSWDVMPDETYFTRMGFNIKLECYEQPSLASFCGRVFDPQDLQQVRDRKSTRLNSSHRSLSRMPSSA